MVVALSWKVSQRRLCPHDSWGGANSVRCACPTSSYNPTKTLDEACGSDGVRLQPHHSCDCFLSGADADRVGEARDGLGSTATPLRPPRFVLAALSRSTKKPTPLRENVLATKSTKSEFRRVATKGTKANLEEQPQKAQKEIGRVANKRRKKYKLSFNSSELFCAFCGYFYLCAFCG